MIKNAKFFITFLLFIVSSFSYADKKEMQLQLAETAILNDDYAKAIDITKPLAEEGIAIFRINLFKKTRA